MPPTHSLNLQVLWRGRPAEVVNYSRDNRRIEIAMPCGRTLDVPTAEVEPLPASKHPEKTPQ